MNFPILSIVLACYNERDNIKVLVPEILEKFKGIDLEIVFVDDGSNDGTQEIIANFQKTIPNINFIERGKLMGLGSALRDGYNAAKGEYIMSFDSDLAIPVEDAKKMADVLMMGKYDLVLGSRYLKGSFYEAPNWQIFKKKVVSRCANLFFMFANFINLTDFTFNCRGIKKEAWLKIKPESNNNFFLFEMVWRASRMRFKITEMPVKFFDRRLGFSKLKLGKESKKYLAEFFKLRYRYFFKKVC